MISEMTGSYDYLLVALSVLIAMFASYAALDLAGRVTAGSGWVRLAWLTGGAIAMGFGIWSMHYIGMLAFSLPVPVDYDWPTVLVSLLAAIFASAVALYVVSRQKLGLVYALIGGVIMGIGIATMHYTGMAAMRLTAVCRFDPRLVTLSVVLAIVISLVALWFAFHFRKETKGNRWRKIASAIVMGAAIPVMHYTGMAAASFIPSAVPPDLSHAMSISSLGTAGIATVTLVVLGVSLLTSLVDRRFYTQALELESTEQRYRQLFERSLAGVYRTTVDGRILDCNDACSRILGYTSREEHLTNAEHDIYLSSSDRETFLTTLKEQRALTNFERCLRRKDSSPVWVLENATFLEGRDGTPSVIEGTLIDITERKQVEKALRESEERFRLLVAGVKDYAILMLDPDGYIVNWNEGAERIKAYKAEEIIGKHFSIFYPAEDIEHGKPQHELDMAAAEEHCEDESWRVRKDGSKFWANVIITALRDKDGNLRGFSKVTRDITERKQVEEELQKARDELEIRVRERTAELSKANEELKKEITERQRAEEELRILNTILEAFHKTLSLKEVYGIALDAVLGITAFDIVMVYIVDENTNEAVLQTHKGLTEDYIRRAGRIPYPKGVTWNVINSGELTLIEDIQKDPDLGPAGRALGLRTVLMVPIKQEEKRIGIINFCSHRVLDPGSRDISLLKAIGSQIGTAIVQAYLYEKSQKQAQELGSLYEDLNRRIKDLEILNTITQGVNQYLNLEETYNVALDAVIGLESVDMAIIYLVDEDRKEAVLQASRNIPEDYINRAGRIPYPKGITWKVINSGEIMNIEDAQKDPNIGPAGRDLGHHGILGLPIPLVGEVIGVIWFFSYKERQFNKQEVDFLTSIGTQIATAVAKAKLYRELSKRNRYETIISTVTRSIHQSLNLPEVLENAVEAMSKKIDSLDNVSIFLVEGGEAVMKANRGYPEWFIERVRRIPYPKGFTWKTIIEGKPRYIADVDQDTFIGPAGREVGTKSYLSMPINLGDKTIGCININSLKKNAFDEEELKLLGIVAQQIEVAIGNAKQAEALRQSEEEISKINEELEKRVIERTSQLETTNKELEAFSYSVSHDLRAPLRAIDGFSRILLEDYSPRLDDEGKRMFNIIQTNARNMGQLIDDLLAFSRLGRQGIRLSNLDIAGLAKAVFEELKTDTLKRTVQLNINAFPTVRGDRAMIHQVFVNLLSNAIKFTSTRENPVIEVGSRVEGEENIYYVRDNGVGFDMQYVNKLFGVFQRLHTQDEFEGTGVGLALVQRIIQRHGGRIWAEGKVNEGATFYFTLPGPEVAIERAD